MAATGRTKAPRALIGPRGPRGRTGATGPAGPPSNGELKRLAAQVERIVKELHTQLTRIAQIQEQLDRFATGQSMQPRDPRRQERVNN